MNVLIIGGGFIGSALAGVLSKNGHNIKLLSRKDPGIENVVFRQATWMKINFHSDFFENVDLVIHALWTTVPFSSMLDLKSDYEENVIVNIKLLEIIKEKNIPKVIFISSGGAVYGNPISEKVNEEHPTNPISSYGITKLASEKYFQLYQRLFGLETLIIRPSNLYGLGQNVNKPQGVIGHLVHCFKSDMPFDLWGDGKGKKDYLHIQAFTSAIVRIIESGFPKNKIFNISFNETFSVLEIINLIEKLTGEKMEINHLPKKLFDVESIAVDSSLFKSVLGWTPEIDLKSGLKKMLL